MGDNLNKTAICILSFNRPNYLEEVLISISKQTTFDKYKYFFYQDGAVNKFSKIRYTEDKDIENCIQLANKYLPHDTEYADYSHNIGVALNFDRAENHLFNVLNYDRIIFLEDDMILNPNYFEMLERLMDKLENTDVAEVTMHGSGSFDLDKQKKLSNKLMSDIHHHWAYGIYKDKWIKRQEKLKWYLDIIKGIDYRKRPSKEIIEGYKKRGSIRKESSQDGAKDVAYMECGLFRINTAISNAFYIGEIGLHSRTANYIKQGWNKDRFIEWDNNIEFDTSNLNELKTRYFKSVKG